MAVYVDEDQIWKCHKHPSRRRKSGICPKCLRERLLTLCPNCATTLPCARCPPPPSVDSSSSSSSSPASFSLFAFSRGGSRHVTANAVPNNIDVDPSLRKSRSVAVSFLRSRSRYVPNGNVTDRCDIESKPLPPKVSRSKINFWSMFRVNKSKNGDVHDAGTEEETDKSDDVTAIEDNPMMMRSRSVAVGGAGNRLTPKHKGWYFPSPINAFRHSKSPLSVHVT